MRLTLYSLAFGIAAIFSLCACGSGNGGGTVTPPPPSLVSYVGTTGTFAAWADPTTGTAAFAPVGSYAAKKQTLHGSVDFTTGTSLSQAAGVEVYKGSDGHIYALDLASTSTPVAQQLSTESAATTDDLCSFTGITAGTGAYYNYAGIFYSSDLQTPTNSSYVYRLPGPDGLCNTSDDIFHMVKTGMSSSIAPVVATGMPVAAVHNTNGGLTGFVITNGANLVLVDSNFANPAVLGTFTAPINVAVALPGGYHSGYPTGQLYVVDGNIVYVNYTRTTVSTLALFDSQLDDDDCRSYLRSLSHDSLLRHQHSGDRPGPASTTIYSMPSNGSAALPPLIPNQADVATLVFRSMAPTSSGV